MYISKQFLNEISAKQNFKESTQFITDHQTVELEEYDVFLSYSYHDKNYAIKLVQLLNNSGITVYIDLEDNEMDRNNVNAKTAKTLASRMDKCKSLVYLYSKASSVSKWCPWELGYLSGKKNFRCAKIPLVEKTLDSTYEKQEYLEIYPTIDYAKMEGKNEYFFWVNETKTKYVEMKKWINGENPIQR